MDTSQPLLAPDFASQQQQVERQRAMAQMLMQRGLQGDQGTQMAGRVAIRNSPLSGLANILSTYAGNKMLDKADARSTELATQRNQATAAALKAGLEQMKTDPAAAISSLAGNPDTAKLAFALAPDIYKPKQDMTPQMLGKYTPDSIAAYQQSQNLADLKPITESLTPYQERSLSLQEQQLRASQGDAAARRAQQQEQMDMGKIPPGYRRTASGDLEPIPGGPADQKAQALAAQKSAGATDVDLALGTLRDAYDRLDKGDGITSTAKGAIDNAQAWLSSSGAGQTVGKMFGTANQSARNDIAMTRPALLAALMKATGMSAKQMDSNAELKLWLATATDPTLDVESNRRALANIEKKYLNPGSGPEMPAAATLTPEDQAAVNWAKSNPNDPRAAAILKMHGG